MTHKLVYGLFSYLRRARPAARMFISNFQKLLFVGQSSLRSDSRSTAKSITTSALSDVRIKRHFRSDKGQIHRCSCDGITRVRANSLKRGFVRMNCSLPKVASVSYGYVVMASTKYIDVLVTSATSSRRLPNP